MVDGVGVGAEKAGPATATINLVAAPAQVARSGSPRFIPSAREPKLPGGEAAKAEKRPVGPAAAKAAAWAATGGGATSLRAAATAKQQPRQIPQVGAGVPPAPTPPHPPQQPRQIPQVGA